MRILSELSFCLGSPLSSKSAPVIHCQWFVLERQLGHFIGHTLLHDLANLLGAHVLDLIIGHGRQLFQLLSAAERRARRVIEKSTDICVLAMNILRSSSAARSSHTRPLCVMVVFGDICKKKSGVGRSR